MDKSNEAYQILQAKASYNASAVLRHGYARLTEGWVKKIGKRLGSKMRLLSLRGSVLSSRKAVDGEPSWELTALDCIVEAGPRPCQLCVHMADRKLEFYATSETDRQRWVKAFEEASNQKIEDYYRIGGKVGKGAFAEVLMCQSTDPLDEGSYVVKRIHKKVSSRHASLQLGRELAIARSVRHPSIVTVWDIFETSTEIMIIMEFCEYGDLFQMLLNRGSFSEAVAVQVFESLFTALSFLHAKGIVHRDIKPANFLAAVPDRERHTSRNNDRREGSADFKFQAKLTDFGLSNVLTGAIDEVMTTPVGTPYFLSPEMIIGKRYGAEVDLWAMGVSLFFFLSGQLPFAGRNRGETYRMISSGEQSFKDPRWSKVSDAAKDLISGLLHKDPALRYSAEDALAHEWLREVGPKTNVDISANLDSAEYNSFGDQRSDSSSRAVVAEEREKADLSILENVLDPWVLDVARKFREAEVRDSASSGTTDK